MPAPNDLTEEEERLFVEQGLQPAGPGGEPIKEGEEEAPSEPVPGQQSEGQPPEPPEPQEPKPGELGSRHRADGTFKNKEELEADAAAIAAQGGQPPQQNRMVPHEALHAERQRSAELARQNQLAVARLNALLMAQQGREQPQQMPSLQDDPAGYIVALEARLAQFEQSRQEEQQFRQVDTALEQDEMSFSQVVPDYDQASEHYVQSRAKELLQFYPPNEVQKILVNEARQIAQQAWQRGQSAGQVVYQLAQARGYNPANTAANPINAPIPARPANAGPTPQAQVAAIAAGQAASRSLSGGVGGGTNTEKLNAEALLNMSDEEFEAHLGLGKKGADVRFAQVG